MLSDDKITEILKSATPAQIQIINSVCLDNAMWMDKMVENARKMKSPADLYEFVGSLKNFPKQEVRRGGRNDDYNGPYDDGTYGNVPEESDCY